jgi:malate dehydrogenase
VIGGSDWAPAAGSDIVVITSGKPRGPNMSRDDLVRDNFNIMKSIAPKLVEHTPEAIIIPVANPLDAMAQALFKLTKFPKQRIIGMAGVLDSARMSTFIAMELDVSVENVSSFVLGGHGDTMVPLVRYCTVAGIPVTQLLPPAKIDAIVERTKNAGGEVVALLKTGSAFVSPALSAIQMAESILLDKKRVLACACLLEGEYGVDGLYVGVPAVLGAGGLERVIEVKLDQGEQKLFDASVQHVRSLVEQIRL